MMFKIFHAISLVAIASAGTDSCRGADVERKFPPNAWGSYRFPTFDQLETFRNEVFTKMPPGDGNQCTEVLQYQVNRHYSSKQDPKLTVFSYYCPISKDFQQAKVDASSTPPKVTFIDSLSDVGISDAGRYPEKLYYTSEPAKEKAALLEIAPIFTAVKYQIPDMCPDPGLKVIFNVQEKDENDLHYWQFPVSCHEDASKYMTIEIFQDIKNCYVQNGDITFASNTTVMGNQRYLRRGPLKELDVDEMIKEEERRADPDSPRAELQDSGLFLVASLSSLILVVAGKYIL